MSRSTHLRPGRRVLFAIAAITLIGTTLTTTSAAGDPPPPSNSAWPASVLGPHLNWSRPAATAAESADTSSSRPTVVFVHGAWADNSAWNSQIAALDKQDYPVISVANPLRGLTSDAAYMRSVLQTINGPIVLVGHSYGGSVITNAARGVDNVEALVYIAGLIPDTGESVDHLLAKNPGTHISPEKLIQRAYPMDDGSTGTDLYVRAEFFRDIFAGDLPSKQTTVMQAEQRPISLKALTELSGDPAWKTLPSWALVATSDNAIPPETQLFMAHRAGATMTSVDASHVPMISHPKETLVTIRAAIHAIE